MKNKIAIVLILFLMCLLVSCRGEKPQDIKKINSEFTVSNHIKSDYLYQQSSSLLIKGKCEVGGTLTATLYSGIDVVVASETIVVDNTGNYSIELPTPSGSFEEYRLEIYDYHRLFVKTYNNLLFGEIHLLLGDHLINNNVHTYNNPSSNVLYTLDYTNPDNNWNLIDLDEENDSFLYNFYELLAKTNKYNKMPIGFVSVTFDKTLIEEWLPLKYANKSSSVISFLNSTGKYYENPHQIGQMSYVANNILSSLYNYSFSDIIISFGVNEFNEFYGKYNSENYYNAYAKMLLYVIRNISDNFYKYNDIALIQTNSIDVDNINVLRNIQSQVANYFHDLLLIPTYDLAQTEDVTFNMALANRYFDIVYGKKVISEYANHFVDESEHIITIELSKSSLFDFHFESLKLYDMSGNLIELEEEKIKGRFNQIIIDLSYENVNEENIENDESNYYQISRIEYAQDEIFLDDAITNNNNLPVIPFIISFE